MNTFSIAICDDEPESCEQILNTVMLHRDSPKFFLKVFCTGEKLWGFIQDERFNFDLIILDIQMKVMDGVAVGNLLRESSLKKQPNILYVSGHSSYAMQLFDVNPLHFLIKPIDKAKFMKCIDKAIARANPPQNAFSYLKEKNVYNVPYSEILYFELKSKLVVIHTLDGSSPSFYGTMEYVQKQARYQQNFIQTHGSFLVNWDYVREVFTDEVILCNGTQIRVTRLFKKDVKDYAKKHIGRE